MTIRDKVLATLESRWRIHTQQPYMTAASVAATVGASKGAVNRTLNALADETRVQKRTVRIDGRYVPAWALDGPEVRAHEEALRAEARTQEDLAERLVLKLREMNLRAGFGRGMMTVEVAAPALLSLLGWTAGDLPPLPDE